MDSLSQPSPPSDKVSSANDNFSDSEGSRIAPAKRRRRSALACTRYVTCKSRKQKCIINPKDETRPCRRCEEAEAICSFTIPSPKDPESHIHCQARIAALERRLARYNPKDELLSSSISISKPSKSKSDIEDSRGEDGRGDDDVAAGVALLSLNAANEPQYLRASSGYFWAKLVSGSFKGPPSPLCQSEGPVLLQRYPPAPPQPIELPDSRTALALFDACYVHLQTRYACLDWIAVKKWVVDQENSVIRGWQTPLDVDANRTKGTSSFFVWMVYAIGARLLQGRSSTGLSIGEPDQYYAAAIMHLDVVVRLHNVHNVQAFLLLVVYSIWSTEGPSAWYLIGMAMRIALEIGMHRKRPRPRGTTRYAEEVRKRTWWGLYAIDRWLSLTLGRPLGISDQDIDQELPANVPCDLELSDSLPPATSPEAPLTTHTFSSMSSAIQMIRLRQIESEIHGSVHVVGSQIHSGLQLQHWQIIEKLDKWKASIVLPPPGSDSSKIPCLPRNYFELKAEMARLALLRPLLASAKPGDSALMMCGKSAAEVCQLDRSLLQLYPANHSLCFSDLHGTFLTGLTVLRVLWIDANAVPPGEANKAVRACSTSLFIYAQHFKDAEPFRDAFEELANICLDNRAGAPDPTNYRSAVTLAGALNRLDQGFVNYDTILGQMDGRSNGNQQIMQNSSNHGNIQPFEGLDDSAWPNHDDFGGLLDGFGTSNDLSNSTTMSNDIDANDNNHTIGFPNMAYPQSSSISDIFNQLLGASTPWNNDDQTASLMGMNGQGVLLPDAGFLNDMTWRGE